MFTIFLVNIFQALTETGETGDATCQGNLPENIRRVGATLCGCPA